jgi:thiosulfate/3-mercaptopyruvate sulfurtransferase
MSAGTDSTSSVPDAPAHPPPLVTTDWLASRLRDPSVRIADVRWYLPHLGRNGRAEYDLAHLPGAVFVDLDSQLASPPGTGPGRHPLPDPRRFASAMTAAGVGPDTHVVAYDDSGGSTAARLWWLLRYFGHPRVSVLDGGLTKWLAERRPVTAEVSSIPPAAFVARPGGAPLVDRPAVQRLAGDPAGVVLDARAAERYEGTVEPIDPRAGHVPGALSAPFVGNLSPDSTFLPVEQLRLRYESLAATPDTSIVAYCGSGITACHTLLALEVAGFPPGALYEGSWSDWSSDPSLPAATGAKPR